jgi:hypothetical protein
MFRNRRNTTKVMSVPDRALRQADRFGLAASLACAVHCAVWPVLLAALPAMGLGAGGWIDLDQGFVVFATLLGASTLAVGYRRHRRFRAWLMLVPGLVLVWTGTFTALHDHGALHAMLMVAGGLLLAAAHTTNLRLGHAAAH